MDNRFFQVREYYDPMYSKMLKTVVGTPKRREITFVPSPFVPASTDLTISTNDGLIHGFWLPSQYKIPGATNMALVGMWHGRTNEPMLPENLGRASERTLCGL